MKDKEIEDAIKEYSDAIAKDKASINAVMQFFPLIQLGQNELQGRQTRRASLLSVGVAFLSLAIAGSALYVSLTTSRSSERWENSQIKILETIRNDINTSANKLNKAINGENGKTVEPITNSTKELFDQIIIKKKPANKSLNQTGANNAPPG